MGDVRVLVVDDQEPCRVAMAAVVEATDGFAVAGSVASGEDSVVALADAVDERFRRQSWLKRLLTADFHRQVQNVVHGAGWLRRDLLDALLEGYDLIHAYARVMTYLAGAALLLTFIWIIAVHGLGHGFGSFGHSSVAGFLGTVTVAAPGIVSYADGERFGPLPLTVECAPGTLTVLA